MVLLLLLLSDAVACRPRRAECAPTAVVVAGGGAVMPVAVWVVGRGEGGGVRNVLGIGEIILQRLPTANTTHARHSHKHRGPSPHLPRGEKKAARALLCLPWGVGLGTRREAG